MPSLGLFGGAVLVAASVAAIVYLIAAWPWRSYSLQRARVAWILSVGAGLYVGCGFVEQWPRWPPTEDRDRLLTILFPLALAVEVACAFCPKTWVRWLLRACLACVAAPILLYKTTYLADLAGPGSAEWPPAVAGAMLALLAVIFLGAWLPLSQLERRVQAPTLAVALALACLAAGFTVMLSGYYRGGLLGLPLAGGLLGSTLAAQIAQRVRASLKEHSEVACFDGALGVGVVGLWAILLVGRFFGSLPTAFALVLLFAPLLAWVAELQFFRSFSQAAKNGVRVAIVLLPLVAIVAIAQVRFAQAWKARPHPIAPSSVP